MDLFSLLSSHPHYRTEHHYEHDRFRSTLTDLERESAEQNLEKRLLEERVKSLEMACAGLWTLLKDKIGCTDDELLLAINHSQSQKSAMVEEHGEHTHCPSCKRKLLARTAHKCNWCGVNL